MQILYGNDGINYTELAMTSDVNDQIIYELGKSRFLSYDFTKKKYPEGKEPKALSFVSTTLNEILDRKHILISQSKRMDKFQTPCYMSHVQIMEIQDGMRSYTNASMYALLDMKFISANDAETYKKGILKLEDFNGRSTKKENDGEYNCGISDKAREAIISLLANCDDSLAKVTVVVDGEQERYNERVKEIILDIYTHIPYGWRGRFGFCSFITTNFQSPDGVKLQFVEKGCPMSGFQNYLDLNINQDEYFEEQMRNVSAEYKEYVDTFLKKIETERKTFFNKLSKLFDIEDGVKEYCKWGKNLVIWNDIIEKISNKNEENNETQIRALIDSWINFIKEHNPRKNSLLMGYFKNKVKEYINSNNEILLYLRNESRWYLKIFCEQTLDEDSKNIKEYVSILKKYSEFFEYIDYSYPIEDMGEVIEYIQKKQNEIEDGKIRLRKLDNLNECLGKLCGTLKNSFSNSFFQEWQHLYLVKCEEEKNIERAYEEKKKREIEYISSMFSDNENFIENCDKYFNEFNDFDVDSQKFFKQTFGKWLLKREIDVFKENFEDAKKLCEKYSSYIFEDDRQEYLKRFSKKEDEEKIKHLKAILMNNPLHYALEMLHEEAIKENPDKQKMISDFVSDWLDKNLCNHVRTPRENPKKIKENIEKMSWLENFAGRSKIDKWIQITDFKKYKNYQKWTTIKEIALFVEYAKSVGKPEEMLSRDTTYWDNDRKSYYDDTIDNKKEEIYILSSKTGEINILLNLEDAIKLAEFLLEPENETILSLKEDNFREFLESSLLNDCHWKCLLKGNYNPSTKNIICIRYFLTDVLLADEFVKEIGNDTINQEQIERRVKKAPEEKQLQYERLVSGKSLQEYQCNWERMSKIMPPILMALLQVFLIKAFSYKIENIGLYNAIVMTIMGIAVIALTFIPFKQNMLNRSQINYSIIESIMFLGLGWIVMFLNILV